MYYSSGNYEAFARPLKPEGIEDKAAWIVGSGLAGLSTAAFLIRDGCNLIQLFLPFAPFRASESPWTTRRFFQTTFGRLLSRPSFHNFIVLSTE